MSSAPAELPPHFITFDRYLPGRLPTDVKGGLPEEMSLHWQVRDSIAPYVRDAPVVLPHIRKDELLPDALFVNEFIMVSTPLRRVLEPWLRDYEFITVKIELWEPAYGDSGGGPLVDGYSWLNSWRRLDVIDWENTEASFFGESREGFGYPHTPVKASEFQKLALKHPVPDDEHFFGLLGVAGEHRYLSTSLHAELIRHRLRVGFVPKLFAWGSMPEGGPKAFNLLLNPGKEER